MELEQVHLPGRPVAVGLEYLTRLFTRTMIGM